MREEPAKQSALGKAWQLTLGAKPLNQDAAAEDISNIGDIKVMLMPSL